MYTNNMKPHDIPRYLAKQFFLKAEQAHLRKVALTNVLVFTPPFSSSSNKTTLPTCSLSSPSATLAHIILDQWFSTLGCISFWQFIKYYKEEIMEEVEKHPTVYICWCPVLLLTDCIHQVLSQQCFLRHRTNSKRKRCSDEIVNYLEIERRKYGNNSRIFKTFCLAWNYIYDFFLFSTHVTGCSQLGQKTNENSD